MCPFVCVCVPVCVRVCQCTGVCQCTWVCPSVRTSSVNETVGYDDREDRGRGRTTVNRNLNPWECVSRRGTEGVEPAGNECRRRDEGEGLGPKSLL